MTRTLPALVAAGLGALAALTPWPLTSCSRANPPCVTHAPVTVGAPVVGPVTYSAPVYSAPTYHAPVYEAEKVYVPFAVPFAYFSFVAAPTTPPPVVVASPPPPQPVAAPAPAPCATACAAAHAPAAPPAVQAGVSAPPPSCSAAVEARLARLEGLLVRLGERQVAVAPQADDGPPPAREAGTTPVSVQTPAPAQLPPEPQPLPGASADLGAVVSLLSARCAQCHSGANARDGITLFNDRGEWQPNVAPGEVLASVRPRGGKPAKMPKGAPVKLSDAEVALVAQWAGGAK
jgi:cytochrome c5